MKPTSAAILVSRGMKVLQAAPAAYSYRSANEGARVAENPFPGWLAEVAADAVVVRPDDIESEARDNLWSFSLTPDQVPSVSIVDVVEFAAGVTDARQSWLSARGAGPMVLYWWHDAQAGQLRFSLVSAVHARLPFGCEVVSAISLAVVASEWLGSPSLHSIPWGELRQPSPDEVLPEPHPLVLPVWSLVLPQTPNR